MRFLLDTHAFLWWITDDIQMPAQVREIISDEGNELFLSVASCWEIAIKAQLGKLQIAENPETYIPDQMQRNAIQGLPIQTSHALHVFNLPYHHRDPFDRMLVSQAQLENLPIITSDSLIAQYNIQTIWG